MTNTRVWADHGCRRYGGCRPGRRCLEHSRTTPTPVGDLISRVLAHIGRQRAAR